MRKDHEEKILEELNKHKSRLQENERDSIAKSEEDIRKKKKISKSGSKRRNQCMS